MLAGAMAREEFWSLSHYEILQAALNKDCICGGRAIAAWEQILTVNGVDVAEHCKSIVNLFRDGGGKRV